MACPIPPHQKKHGVKSSIENVVHSYDPCVSTSRSSSTPSSTLALALHASPRAHPPFLTLSPSGPTIDCDQGILVGPMSHNIVHNNSGGNRISNFNSHREQKAQTQHGPTYELITSSREIATTETREPRCRPDALIAGCLPYRTKKNRTPSYPPSSMTNTLLDKGFGKSRRGSVSTPCLVSPLVSSTEKTRVAFNGVFGLKMTPQTTLTPTKIGIASFLANEILSLIFCHLMDRKSILNCSLVSTHWHGPARLELARMVQDMPFNGQGLLHTIRTRFAQDTFPIPSMALFDKLISNLSEVYFHSNPETKQVFAPAHAPDLLYNLIWTFLFIDQEFRNPRAQPMVTYRYFERLMRREGVGYPLEFFDKRVLKNIYDDIRSQPLLPAPHMITAIDTRAGENEENIEGLEDEDAHLQGQEHTPGTSSLPQLRQQSGGSFMNLAGSIKLASFKRVSRWWRSVRDENENEFQAGSTSQHDLPSLASGRVSSEMIDSNMLAPQVLLERTLSSLSAFPQGSTSSLTMRSIFSKSDMSINKSERSGSLGTMIRGFTSVPHGWHVAGDGLDKVVRFPQVTRPSALGSKFVVLRFADLMLDQEADD